MREREEEVGDLVLDQHVLFLLEHVEHVAPVRVVDDAALGRAGRAGRVDVARDRGALDRGDAPLEVLLGAVTPLRAKLVQRDRVVRLDRLDRDHVLEGRELIAHLADLFQLRRVLDDNRLGFGVVDHVLALLGRVRLVHRNRGGAEAQDAEVGVRPLGAGMRKDRDLVAGSDSDRLEAEGDLLDDPHELLVRGVQPLVAFLVAHGDQLRVLLRGQRDEIRERLRTGCRGTGRGGGLNLHLLLHS